MSFVMVSPSQSLEASDEARREDGRPTPLVGRLAPSPTGLLHLGHARSFLLAWWSIRSRGGRVLLRMEDLDPERVKPGSADAVLRDLEWLGMDWDGPVTWQSERSELYHDALRGLEAKQVAYPCVCSRKEVAHASRAPHEASPSVAALRADQQTQNASVTAEQSNKAHRIALDPSAIGDIYPGTCRGRFASLQEAQATGRPVAWRFHTERGPAEVVFEDAMHGRKRSCVWRETGDFMLTRRDLIASYQLAVVVDDVEQGISEVLRGDDLLSSTARQELIYAALGAKPPCWIHVPLVTDRSGRRLAKRSDDLSLTELREGGVKAESIVRWVAASAGMQTESGHLAADWISEWSLDSLSREAVVVDPAHFTRS
ncbi:MAG: glutamyl-tRNA synthetase [Planctomycetota bacterium]|jgi:glutamyl-tRNA synthetase